MSTLRLILLSVSFTMLFVIPAVLSRFWRTVCFPRNVLHACGDFFVFVISIDWLYHHLQDYSFHSLERPWNTEDRHINHLVWVYLLTHSVAEVIKPSYHSGLYTLHAGGCQIISKVIGRVGFAASLLLVTWLLHKMHNTPIGAVSHLLFHSGHFLIGLQYIFIRVCRIEIVKLCVISLKYIYLMCQWVVINITLFPLRLMCIQLLTPYSVTTDSGHETTQYHGSSIQSMLLLISSLVLFFMEYLILRVQLTDSTNIVSLLPFKDRPGPEHNEATSPSGDTNL
jgi:hypothetical protein